MPQITTENSFSQLAGAESVGTSSIKHQMLSSLQSSKEYRHAFVEEVIRSRITAQIHALRTRERLDYKEFAEKIHKKKSWGYRLEDPNEASPTIPTLLEVAEAFDIGLDVRFRPFSELLDDVIGLKPGSFTVPSFEVELKTGAFSKSHRRTRLRRKSTVTNKSRSRHMHLQRIPPGSARFVADSGLGEKIGHNSVFGGMHLLAPARGRD